MGVAGRAIASLMMIDQIQEGYMMVDTVHDGGYIAHTPAVYLRRPLLILSTTDGSKHESTQHVYPSPQACSVYSSKV